MVSALFQSWWEMDVTGVLPVISVPTMVVHRLGNPVLPVEAARYVAERIPGAELVELPGDDHVHWLGGLIRGWTRSSSS